MTIQSEAGLVGMRRPGTIVKAVLGALAPRAVEPGAVTRGRPLVATA